MLLVNYSWLVVEHLVSMTFVGYFVIPNPELKYFFLCVCSEQSLMQQHFTPSSVAHLLTAASTMIHLP